MKVNVFRGARRISVLLGAVWVIGCVGSIAFAKPSLFLMYEVTSFGSVPKLASNCDYHIDTIPVCWKWYKSTLESPVRWGKFK